MGEEVEQLRREVSALREEVTSLRGQMMKLEAVATANTNRGVAGVVVDEKQASVLDGCGNGRDGRRKIRPSVEPGKSRYWTAREHELFLEALKLFGNRDLRNIAAHVGTRNMTQVRTHAQKYYIRLTREAKQQKEVDHQSEDSGKLVSEQENRGG